MNVSELPDDMLRCVIIKYIDDSNMNKKKLQLLGSHKINDMLKI
jgi:hypothetical protein